jgi:hypothetical protein
MVLVVVVGAAPARQRLLHRMTRVVLAVVVHLVLCLSVSYKSRRLFRDKFFN